MFKQLQGFIKPIRSCLGTVMKPLAGSSARSGSPPSRSSREPVGLDASSPVATREASKSMPKPTEPSKLSGLPIAGLDPTPKPPATSSSSGSKQPLTPIPEPVLAAAAAPRSNAIPGSLLESSLTALPGDSFPEPIPANISRSSESLRRAEAEHPDEALRQSEHSSRTGSHGQIFTHERQLPNEFHAAPWHSGPLTAERSSQLEQEVLAEPKGVSSISRPNPVFIDQASTPLLATEGPPAREDNTSTEMLSARLSAKIEQDQRLAQLADELARKSGLLEDAGANAAEAMKRAGLELRKHADIPLAQGSRVEQKDAELADMQANHDELLPFREQHVRALERASQKIAQIETELAEMRAEQKAKQSELEAVRSRLADAEKGWAKRKTEENTLCASSGLTTAEVVERIRALEAEVTPLLRSEKSLEEIEPRNEG